MKKLFLLITVVLMQLLASAATVEIDGICYNLVAKIKEAEVTSNPNGYNGNLEIPSSVHYGDIEYNVTKIGDSAFGYCASLTSITIPNSVTSIGYEVFSGCTALADVYCFAEKTPSTDNYFWGTSGISNAILHVPASSLGAYQAAVPWKYFKKIVAIEGTTDIPTETVDINGIYYNLDKQKKEAEVTRNPSLYTGSIEIPPSIRHEGIDYNVTSIGLRAFQDCRKITSITIPDGVTSIGSYAFSLCIGLTSFTIPSSVSSIGDYAFQYCTKLTSITIPEGVKSIKSHTFESCTKLTSVTIPNSVTSIGEAAFAHCSGLTSISIPDNVTSIGNFAFSGCSKITHITIPKNVTHIDGFSGCSSLISIIIPDGVKSIELSAFSDCSSLTSITIPNSVTSIGGCAFSGCSSLTSITIPNDVKSIKYNTFENCKSLTSITIPNTLSSIDYAAFRNCSSLTSFTIPNSVTSIESDVFRGCSSLTSINIPNSVTRIETEAFYGCSSLTSITIPNNVTYIRRSAFAYCSGLTSITVTKRISIIGLDAFSYCPELTDFYCLAEDFPLDETSIFNGSYIEYATLHVPASSISAYQSKDPWKNFKSIVALKPEDIPSGVAKVYALPVLIQAHDGIITVKGINDGTQVSVYDIDGKHEGVGVGNHGVANIETSLKTGNVAIVSIGMKSIKVVMR